GRARQQIDNAVAVEIHESRIRRIDDDAGSLAPCDWTLEAASRHARNVPVETAIRPYHIRHTVAVDICERNSGPRRREQRQRPHHLTSTPHAVADVRPP